MATITTQPMAGNDVWSLVDESLNMMGIHCGMPQGVGEAHITTKFKPLANLLKTLNPTTLDEQESDVFTDDDGITWKVRKNWEPALQWKGSFGRAIILENQDNKKCSLVFSPHKPAHRRLEIMMATLGCRSRFAFKEPELKAQQRLFKELSDSQQGQYITSDAFAEVGKSGIIYVLRKSKPTVAIREQEDGSGGALCALCLHPVAYYTATWAGVLPPSDEVLAHLLMIRHSERFYWRKANQIPLEYDTSGV